MYHSEESQAHLCFGVDDHSMMGSTEVFRSLGPAIEHVPPPQHDSFLDNVSAWFATSTEPVPPIHAKGSTDPSLDKDKGRDQYREPVAFVTDSTNAFSCFNSLQLNEQAKSVPKMMPAWIDPHVSFISRENPVILFAQICAFLKQSAVDIQAFHRKLKISVVSYGLASPLPTTVRIRLYRQQHGQTVVEFQKRSGCSAVCMRLFRATVAGIGTSVSRLYSQPPRDPPHQPPHQAPIQQAALPFPSTLLPLASSLLPSAELVGNLFDGSNSVFLDQQKEAISELVSLSSTHGACLIQSKQDIVGWLVRLLLSEDDDIVRCGALILSNTIQAIAACRSGPSSVATELLDPMFEVLGCPWSLVRADTKRHLSAALAELAKAGATFPPQYLQRMEKYDSVEDEVLRKNIAMARSSAPVMCTA